MKATLATCKDDIFPPGAANTGGLEWAARLPECALSCWNLNLGASRTPCDHVTLLRSAECSNLYVALYISYSQTWCPFFQYYDKFKVLVYV